MRKNPRGRSEKAPIRSFLRPPKKRRNPMDFEQVEQVSIAFLEEIFGEGIDDGTFWEDVIWFDKEGGELIRQGVDGGDIAVTLRLNVWQSMGAHGVPDGAILCEIDRLIAEPVGTGAGAEVLRMVTEAADKHGVWLALEASAMLNRLPQNDRERAQDRLVKFYARHGFKMMPRTIEARSHTGVRRPERNPTRRLPRGPVRTFDELVRRVRRAKAMGLQPFGRWSSTRPRRGMPESIHFGRLSLFAPELSRGLFDEDRQVDVHKLSRAVKQAPGNVREAGVSVLPLGFDFHLESRGSGLGGATTNEEIREAEEEPMELHMVWWLGYWAGRNQKAWFLTGEKVSGVRGSDGEPLVESESIDNVAEIKNSVFEDIARSSWDWVLEASGYYELTGEEVF